MANRGMIQEKKIGVVTGANRGIGLEICRQLAKFDNQVILTSRNIGAGEAAQAKLKAEGIIVDFHQLDVTSAQSIARLATYVENKYGRLDILINNAGVFIDDKHSLLTVDIDTIRKTMDINSYGSLMMIQAFTPLLKKADQGRIINVSSGIGELADLGPSYPSYRLSKITLNLHTQVLADELSSAGILINAMCPGWVKTDMGGANAPRSVAEGADTAVWLAIDTNMQFTGKFFRDRQEIAW